MGNEHDLIQAGGEFAVDQAVALFDLDRDDTAFPTMERLPLSRERLLEQSDWLWCHQQGRLNFRY